MLDLILQNGFRIIGLKLVRLNEAIAGEFYAVHREKPFYPDLVKFMTSGNCVVIVLEKENAVADYRQLMGATDPLQAAIGTIRRTFAESKRQNIVHGSDSIANAFQEIRFFFSQSELIPTTEVENC